MASKTTFETGCTEQVVYTGYGYRYQSNRTLIRWREEMRAEVASYTRLIKSDPTDSHYPMWVANRYKLCGRIARITGLLRDRWVEQ